MSVMLNKQLIRAVILTGMLGFESTGLSQENRSYILSADFGPGASHADYWYPLESSSLRPSLSQAFRNVFNFDGFLLTINAKCASVSPNTNCGLKTIFESIVSDSINDALVADGLETSTKQMEWTLTDLPAGSYDMKLFFHQAKTSYDSYLKLDIWDARSLEGFRLSDAIRVSTGTAEPRVSTFSFPIEANGSEPVRILISGNSERFIVNGFQLTSYRYRIYGPQFVELIPTFRKTEALVSAYFDSGDYYYACQGLDQQGQSHLGWWNPETNQCTGWFDDQFAMLNDFLLVKFDPYYQWTSSTASNPNFSGAINFNSSPGEREFACLALADSGEYIGGIVFPEINATCQIFIPGYETSYNSYWIFSEK